MNVEEIIAYLKTEHYDKAGVSRAFAKLVSFLASDLIGGQFKGRAFSLAVTEPHSSYLKDIRSKGTPDGKIIRVSGEKCYITNAGEADYYLTLVRIEKSLSFVYIPAEMMRVNVYGDKSCLTGLSMGAVSFDGEVDLNNLVGKTGQGQAIFNRIMNHERVLTAIIYANRMRYLLNDFETYAKARPIAGASLWETVDTLSIARLIDEVEASTEKALSLMDHSDIAAFQAIARHKILASDNYFEFVARIMEFYGARSLTLNDLSEELNNALAAKIYSGSNAVLRRIG